MGRADLLSSPWKAGIQEAREPLDTKFPAEIIPAKVHGRQLKPEGWLLPCHCREFIYHGDKNKIRLSSYVSLEIPEYFVIMIAS